MFGAFYFKNQSIEFNKNNMSSHGVYELIAVTYIFYNGNHNLKLSKAKLELIN